MNHLAKLLTKLQKTKRNHSSKSSARKRFGNRLGLENLEERRLLAGFNFTNFDATNSADLNLLGSAAITASNSLRLTPSVSSTGAAWYDVEKSIVAGNFETTFQFKLSTATGGSDGSDGFAFVIQNSSVSEIRGGGGALGYDGMTNSVAIEFDTWLNNGTGDPWNDPSQSHISVHTNGTGANGTNESFRVGSFYNTSGFILDNAQVHTARIRYAPGTLTVYLDNLTTPVLTVPLDLNTTLGLDHGRAWIGFTGAAGGSPLNQDFLNWSFSADDNVVVANPASVVEGASTNTSTLLFAIDRLGSSAGSVVVNWSTADGTAIAGTDYIVASGQVVFQDGETQKTVPVIVKGDGALEPDETFKLILSTPTPSFTAASGLATILNDDTSISVSDFSRTEGDNRFGVSLGDLVDVNANGGLNQSTGMAIGPDGNLYVGSFSTHEVLRYDSTTGAFMGAFVLAGSGGLSSPAVQGLSFRPDGKLYVASRDTNNVLRYDSATGAFIDTFITTNSGGLQSPKGMIFGPDGNLYISSGATNQVLRYDGTTGAFLGVFVAAGSGGLTNPRFLTFGPDGALYVSSSDSDSVLKYNGTTGGFVGTFISSNSGGLDLPAELLFAGSSLYVASQNTSQVLRYNSITGAFIEVAVSAGNNGLYRPVGLLLDASNNLLVGSNKEILRFGSASQAAFSISLSFPSALPVTVTYATQNGSASAGSDYAASSGVITFAPGQTSRTILIPILDDSTIENTETFFVNLSHPVGATLADSQAIGTIVDDDATKFYVVDDGSPDQTYEYGATGSAIENYSMQSTNTAPRGAASTAVGDKVWVVDANKKVYVYNNSGTLQGTGWSAGSLQSSSTAGLQGITTNGTDVWLVEDTFNNNKNDKIYRYKDAASRDSGSQNMFSSFPLNSANRNPTDLVTDGTHIWVLNNTLTTDSVFKYTALDNFPVPGKPAGTLLGSWTITGGGGSPTGITLDPSNTTMDMWIVDNSTRRVYQFDSARGRQSGSALPSSSFLLAAGNINPQGIADPPPPGSMLASQVPTVASSKSIAEVEKPNRKSVTSSDPFIAQVDSIFENWNEDSVSSQTKRRLAGRR